MGASMKLLRATAVILVLLLAGLGVLFVLGLVPREVLLDGSLRIVAIAGIVGAAAFVIGLLVNGKPPR